MIVPSIDLQDGHAVQLVGGKELAIDAGDPRPIAEKFARVGEVAVIDLDAAMGTGSNAAVICDLLSIAPCRVGGGVRDADTAIRWLDAGARSVILGTKAVPEILSQLPRDRVIAALDSDGGEIVVEGWKKRTGRGVLDQMKALQPYVGGFLVTFVELEGRLGGTDLDRVSALVAAAGDARVTIAGGVSTLEEIDALDRLGADAQVGMALYTNQIHVADAFTAPLGAAPWPAVVTDAGGLALSCRSLDAAAVRAMVDDGVLDAAPVSRLAVDRSRSSVCVQTGEAWRDPAWGPLAGLPALTRLLAARVSDAPPGSYTRRLLDDPALLRAKLIEEAGELADAEGPEHVAEEAADVIYFALVACARAGVPLTAVTSVLDQRAFKVTRRKGDAKPPASPDGG